MTQTEKLAQKEVDRAVEDIKKVLGEPITSVGAGTVERRKDEGGDPEPMPIHPGDPELDPIPEKGTIIRERRITEDRDGFYNVEIYIEKWVDGVLVETRTKVDRTDLVFPGQDDGKVVYANSHHKMPDKFDEVMNVVKDMNEPLPDDKNLKNKSLHPIKKSPEPMKSGVPPKKSPQPNKNLLKTSSPPPSKLP